MYYRLKHSIDQDIIGEFPQSINAAYDKINVNDEKFIDKIFFEEVSFEPIVANAILEKEALLTDLISVFCKGFSLKLLLSSKLKNIIENIRGTGLQFFNSSIIYKNAYIEKYWIMNLYETNPNFIDYQNSIIYLTKFGFQKIERVYISSKNDFFKYVDNLQKINSDLGLLIDELSFINDSKISEDFFALRYVEGGVGYFVSEKLKLKIETSGCTGIDFESINSESVIPSSM